MTDREYQKIIDNAYPSVTAIPCWNVSSDLEAYSQELNFNNNGIMGYINS